MKTIRIALLLSCLTLVFSTPPDISAQTTTFTYQGRLADSNGPVTGLHDFEFRLFNAATGGAQQGPTVTLNDLGVTNGLFVTPLDFGANFHGADRFLQISVRPGASAGAYATLSPRSPSLPRRWPTRPASLPLGQRNLARNGNRGALAFRCSLAQTKEVSAGKWTGRVMRAVHLPHLRTRWATKPRSTQKA